MPDIFRFDMEPMFLLNGSRVVVLTEDFEKLICFAERWLRAHPDDNRDNRSLEDSPELDLPLFPLPTDDYIRKIYAGSIILNSAEGQKLGKSPLDFLSKELFWFTTATKIFSTESLLPKTDVAADFHKACNNFKNVLVIIKSGQYIAGGYTEVPFESRERDAPLKPDPSLNTFIFSVNRRKIYRLKDKKQAIYCGKDLGPVFGYKGFYIGDDYADSQNNGEGIHYPISSFHSPGARPGELFGSEHFAVDLYEVWCLK